MTDVIQVATTTASKSDAERIAERLLSERLAACVQISGPITSHYFWDDKKDSSDEWICVIKTRLSLYDRLESAIREVHPYDVPEILATPVIAGAEAYLNWLQGELAADGDDA